MNKEKKRKYIFAQLNSLPNAFQYVEVTNYIKSLEQENKELAKEIDLWTSKYNKEFDKNKEQENKIDKAIEYIEKHSSFINYLSPTREKKIGSLEMRNVRELLEILKDGDVNEY